MAVVNGAHSDIRRVVVLGALFPASSIIKVLRDSDLEIHVVHPRPTSTIEKGVTYHESETYGETLKPLLSNLKPDLIISTVHGGSFDTQKEIVDIAVECGVPRFIPPEFGQDSLSEKVQERIPPCRERARTIKYLQKLASAGTLSWVAVATGVDLSRGLLNGNLGFDIKWQSATLHGSGKEHFAASSSLWLGRVVLAIIQRWHAVENHYLYASEMTTTGNDVVAALDHATGKQFEASRADVDECVREAQQRIERGFPDAGMFLMGRSVMYDERIGGVRPFEEDDAKSKLGLQGQKLDDVIEWVVHEAKHHDKGGCGCD